MISLFKSDIKLAQPSGMRHRMAAAHFRRMAAGAVTVSGLCAVLLVSLHAMPVPHGYVLQEGPPLPLTQLPATTLQPRSWVSVTLPPKETMHGSSAAVLPPPSKDPYANFNTEDPADDENPHHIFMSQKEKDKGTYMYLKIHTGYKYICICIYV